LGYRDPRQYGPLNKEQFDAMIREHAARRSVEVDIRYTNSSAECIELIQGVFLEGWDGLIMNPGSFTQGGHDIAGALMVTGVPYVEVHMKNLDAIGVHSVLSKYAVAVVKGFREKGYLYAIDGLCELLREKKEASQ
jgi:3-dehydroquinate dehydratase-2